MHSFKAAHNEVRWCLEVLVVPIRWPKFRRRFLVCVYPPSAGAAKPEERLADSASR